MANFNLFSIGSLGDLFATSHGDGTKMRIEQRILETEEWKRYNPIFKEHDKLTLPIASLLTRKIPPPIALRSIHTVTWPEVQYRQHFERVKYRYKTPRLSSRGEVNPRVNKQRKERSAGSSHTRKENPFAIPAQISLLDAALLVTNALEI